MKITNARVIVCCPGRNFVTLKIETDAGLTGLGDASLNGRELAVASYLNDHVIPCLIVEVTRHRQLAAIQRRVAQAGEALIGFDFQGDEIAAGATDDDTCVGDLHDDNPCPDIDMQAWVQHALPAVAHRSTPCRPSPRA